jgi:hypothetical protein
VAALSILVALGATLPVYARFFAGPKAHACHCEIGAGHAHCACPICFPELEPDLLSMTESVKGRCGDDDRGWRTLSEPAVLVAPVITLAPHARALPSSSPSEIHPVAGDPPEPRPPRAVA